MWAESHRVLNRLLDVTGNSRYFADRYTPGTPEWDLAHQFAEARRLIDRITADPGKDPREIWNEALADYIDRNRGDRP